MKGKLKKLDKDKLPVYEIVVEEGDDTGISLISLVEDPAIMMKGMTFNTEKSQYAFKEVDNEKQIIVGPALIPGMRIYREDQKFGEYYVVFSKETIETMVEKFNKYGSNRKINVDHSNQMVDAFIMEDWIVCDEVYDKSRKYGFEVPVGTYMIMVKIEDKEFWNNEVKGQGKFGFSIEGLLGQQLISMRKEATIDDLTEEDLIQIFSEVFITDSTNVDRMKYFEEEKKLVIKFNDGSYYTYLNVSQDIFDKVLEGDARCKTSGSNEFGEWKVGDYPSIGAAVHRYLVVEKDRHNITMERGGSFFSSQVKMKSYADYPDGVKNNAKRVLDWTEKNGWGSCGTPVGKIRANQLANGEAISLETIKRMYSYLSRHEGDLDHSKSYSDGCGKLMYDSWGGKAALGWSHNKLKELGELKDNESYFSSHDILPSPLEKN